MHKIETVYLGDVRRVIAQVAEQANPLGQGDYDVAFCRGLRAACIAIDRDVLELDKFTADAGETEDAEPDSD